MGRRAFGEKGKCLGFSVYVVQNNILMFVNVPLFVTYQMQVTGKCTVTLKLFMWQVHCTEQYSAVLWGMVQYHVLYLYCATCTVLYCTATCPGVLNVSCVSVLCMSTKYLGLTHYIQFVFEVCRS